MADITKDQVIDFLSSMPVMEMAALVKDLEDKWGVTAAAPVAVAAAAPAAGPAEEQTEFDVELKGFGDKKIAVIKVVREVVPGLGLKEAKSLVESAPCKVKEGISKEEADEMVAKLKEAGADAAAV